MINENNKKILTRHSKVTSFLVVFLISSFLFGGNVLAVNDYTKATGATPISTSWNNSVSNYDKPLNGSLSAPEWNGLFYDFVNTWTTANMAGPLGIGSASPSAALDIFSKVKITSGGIIYNTDSGRYLDMSGVLSDSLKVSGNLYSTAGVLKIDGTGNNYLMGNVGIGTVSPAAALHVNYPTSGSAIFQVGTADGGSNADIKLGYNGYGWYWRYLGSGAGDNNELQLWSEGAGGTDQQAYGIKQSGIITFPKNVYFGGKVGISTTTPTSALDVNGLIKMRSYTISQPEDVINKSYLDSALSSSTASIITQVATSSFWQGSLTGDAYSSNTGNIGIGTSTPGAKLQVNGNAIFGTVAASAAVANPLNVSFGSTYGNSTPGSVNNLKWDLFTSSSSGSRYGIGMSSGLMEFQAGPGGGLGFFVNQGTEVMRIAAAGNVGIGTNNPSAKLDIQGSFGNNLVIGSSGNAGSLNMRRGSDGIGVYSFGFPSATESMEIRNSNSGGGGYYTWYTNFSSVVAERMRLDNAGNLGINNVTPVYKLDVNGTAQFTNSVIVGTPTAASHAATKSYVDSAAGGGIGSGTSGQTLRHDGTSWIANSNLFNNGTNVGIGTSTPIYKLDVVGTARISSTLTVGSTVSAARFSPTSSSISGNSLYLPTSNTIGFSTASLERMRIDSTGNIGIGTTTPVYKLDVNGTAQFTNSVIVGTPTAASHAATKSYVDSAAGGGVGAGTSGQTLRHNGTNWVANSTLYNNGTNIGIGTTGPGSKLDVRGGVNITGASGFSEGIRLHAVGGISSVWFNAVSNSGFDSGMFGITTDTTGMRFRYGTGASPSDLVNISNNGNVGINTTTPAFKLDVNGTAQFTNSVIVGTPTAASHAATKSYVDSAAGGGVGAGTSGQTLRHNGTNWVSNSSLYNNGTNVGIGTTAATSKLTVAGDIKHTGMMTSQGANYSFSWMKFDQDINGNSLILGSGGLTSIGAGESSDLVRANVAATTETLYLASDNDIAFRTNLQSSWASSTAAMNISAIGNVGIGSVNPTAKLYVNGTAQFTNSVIVGTPTATNHATTKSYVDSAVSGVGGGIGTGTSGQTLRNNGTSWVSSSALYNNGTNIGINSAIPLVRLTVNQGSYNWPATSTTIQTGGFRIQAESGGNVTLDAGVNGASGAWLQTTNRTDLSQEYPLMLNPNGGNVGVGTTVASYNLDVTGTGRFTNTVNVGTPTAASHAATKSYVDSTAGGGVGSGTSGQTLRHNGTSWIANSNFYNNGTNIGIGTTTPTEKLEVNGRLKIGNNTVSGENITFDGSTSAGMRVANSSGYISITPLNSSWAHIYTDRYNFIFDKPVYSIVGKFSAYNTSNLELQTAGTTRMTLNATTGYVGIGTTTPDFKLDVAGTAQFTNSVIVGTPTAASHATTKSYVDSAVSGVGGGISTGTSGQTLRHNGTSWVSNSVLYNNGTNVGVGTTNPGSKLEVYGGSIKINGGDINFAMTAGQTATKLVSYSNASGLWMIQPTSQSLILADAVDWDRSAAIQYTPGTTGALAGRLMIGQTAKNSANYTHGITSLYTSGVEQLRINSSGNVGIGTTTPTFKLDVVGTAQFSQPVIVGTPTATNHAATKSYVDSTAASAASSAAGGGVGTGTSGQTLRHNGTSWVANSLFYNNGTNIGIGTTNPGSLFSILKDSTYNNENSGGLEIAAGTATTSAKLILGAVGTSYSYIQSMQQDWSWATRPLVLMPNGGNVGIGTITPAASLDIFGKLKFTSGGTIYNTDSARWLDMTGTLTDSLKASGDFYSTAGRLKMDGTGISYVMGTFGVGTAAPSKTMQVYGAGASFRVGPNYTTPDRDYIDLLSGGTDSLIQTNNEGFIFNNLGGPLTLQTSGGNVGIATTTPTEAKLVINAGTGMAVKAYGNGIFTGTLQTQTGSDFAEEFITSKDLEPGTVVVMDDNGHKSVKPCAKSYDKTVVGIVSNDPSIIAGRVESKHKAIIAMMGVVKVKVSDVNGKISKGDLLTTSGITGYAMKAQDSKPGTIIGKALENLSSSTGQINVLVNLQ